MAVTVGSSACQVLVALQKKSQKARKHGKKEEKHIEGKRECMEMGGCCVIAWEHVFVVVACSVFHEGKEKQKVRGFGS